MSDEGENTCPLCAEEMDLTDQQLKPCKCGYEICVWCWHNIMNMAEKDDTEGRCPACRTPYNKEKIVGMASKCERLVAEISMEKKKSQKGKSKTSEGRKQLSNVRVIQRNLVYIVGLPLTLADEDLLQRREYFGQYGKVLKVSISRTAAGAIQHFPNNTCSVYITYSKEEEALRSIQSVHGFILEGRPLRACFGTTKYCHAWLRNVPCSNPDCLYLHEIGSQEDSFTKDEIISAYTRNRVQQVAGVINDQLRRSGNILPPPSDDYGDNSSSSFGKPTSRSPTNSSANTAWSPPNSSSGRSTTLPAAASWGTRASVQPNTATIACSNGPSKQMPASCNGSLDFAAAVANPILPSSNSRKKLDDECRIIEQNDKVEHLDSMKDRIDKDRRTRSVTPVTEGVPSSSAVDNQLCTSSPWAKDASVNIIPDTLNSLDLSKLSGSPILEKDPDAASEVEIQKTSSAMTSMVVDRHQKSQLRGAEQFMQPLNSFSVDGSVKLGKDVSVTRPQSDLMSKLREKVDEVAISDVEEDLLSFKNQRLRDPEVVLNPNYISKSAQPTHLSNDSMVHSIQPRSVFVTNSVPSLMDHKLEKDSFPLTFDGQVNSYGYPATAPKSFSEHSHLLLNGERRDKIGRHEVEAEKFDHKIVSGMGESSIISNILSMDFDPFDESLSSPQNLAKLLGEPDKTETSLRVPKARKAQNSNQSRFSFARGEECTDQVSDTQMPAINVGEAYRNHTFSNGFDNNRDGNGFSSFHFEEANNFGNICSPISSNKISVSRAQISAPPGFSGPSRAPPPGFTPHERMDQNLSHAFGSNGFDISSLMKKQHQAPPTVNIASPADIEFMDPAIMAVGKQQSFPGVLNSMGFDMRSNSSPQLSSYENDARLQLLMQRSFSTHQNQRYAEMGGNFLQRADTYGVPSRVSEQTLFNSPSPYAQPTLPQSRSTFMSNGHWDNWNELHGGNDMAMAELLRAERNGLNKFYSGYEDSKFRLPNSADPYNNRTFGL